MRRLLERIGLDRPETRAWAMYDWANSAFQCTIITAVFPVYYGSVAAAGLPGSTATARFATATTVALTIIALASPILGAYADFAGANLAGADLSRCQLAGADFTGANLTGADFTGADMQGARFDDVSGREQAIGLD